MIHHYLKEQLNSGFVINGTRVPWEPLGGNQGVVALDDANEGHKKLIDGLSKAQGKRGIVKISEAQYTQKKTLHPWPQYAARLNQQRVRERLQAIGPQPRLNQNRPGVAAGAKPQLTRAELLAATEAAITKAIVPPAASADALTNVFKPATGRAGKRVKANA